ncbi:hypothetical protein [Planococcus sp. ANT_H30]|nr:hypothetical protein [Planococcus sp. ANT_H30]
MYEFRIKYESYLGRDETMTITADTESDARRIFYAERPLSEINSIEKL